MGGISAVWFDQGLEYNAGVDIWSGDPGGPICAQTPPLARKTMPVRNSAYFLKGAARKDLTELRIRPLFLAHPVR